ncbi:rhamnogalacturonan acetylesterase [Undibacterium sp. CY18W]|uniref:Rhamnogalacturonan acetylesterase n=1 Tax=Undibacterium hunanense TaxID=2762292 RepID=A0ABR6ZN50_9BURK|nr:rhamnogalacturonan acetylesterase [Undibacterium hunanense]MBC3917003.1 rhamnogalacturonan acetylesterase [Undibacterium hunanense]
MKLFSRSFILTAISALVFGAYSTAASADSASTDKPVRMILVGDSTMAPNSGYGDAFCKRFKPEVTCLNLAKGGRSSSSYRAEGSWDIVQNLLKNREQFSQTYVLIQFGHNDQPGKPGRSTDLATEFPVNIARYVDDLQAAGAQAVLVTPLTRRTFKGSQLQNDLRPWAEASMTVAANKHVPLLDLNADSYRSVQAMGQAEADTLAMAPPPPATTDTPAPASVTVSAPVSTPAPASASAPSADIVKTERAGAARPLFDRTHLGSKGAAHFSAIVLTELLQAVPALDAKVSKEARP